MSKSAEAFRTISEVATELDVPKHVLRFWEARFPHIRPMKRGGGRRYYRPEDMELLRGIRHLLHAEGYTIKGVQKILREQGVDTVKAAGLTVAAPGTGRKAAAAERETASARVGVAEAGEKRAAMGAAKRKANAVVIPLDAERRALLAQAIAELRACRQMLAASGGEPQSAPAARRARA